MDLEASFPGVVVGGRAHFDDSEAMWKFLPLLEGKRVEFVVRELRPNRSKKQNNWYWKFLEGWGKHAGHVKEDLHEDLKHKFLLEHEDSPLPSARSTKKLTTAEMSDYIDKVVQLAAELGYVHPEHRPLIVTIDEAPTRRKKIQEGPRSVESDQGYVAY